MNRFKKEELLKILDFFGLETEHGSQRAGDLKKCIMKIKREELIRKSHALVVDLPHKTLAGDVRTEVFGVILGKEIGMSKAEETAVQISAGSL